MKLITNNAHQEASTGYNPVEYWQRKCIEYQLRIADLRSEIIELRDRELHRKVNEVKSKVNRSISFGLVK